MALRTYVYLALVGLLAACRESTSDLPVNPRTGDVVIPFNAEYTIEYPAATFRGHAYRKVPSASDQTAVIDHNGHAGSITGPSCSYLAYPCLITEYGDSLTQLYPRQPYFFTFDANPAPFDQRQELTRPGHPPIIVFYGPDPDDAALPYKGVIYVTPKTGTIPRRIGSFSFSDETKDAMFHVISTLTPR